ncbi:hypothetical protein [Streptomyces flaveus]|uniref:hypothetical protein n=1 Tax=Streptomyces flaveus TaxID=66370 RepID=UPI003325C690
MREQRDRGDTAEAGQRHVGPDGVRRGVSEAGEVDHHPRVVVVRLVARDGDGDVRQACRAGVLASHEAGVLVAVERPQVQRVLQERRTVGPGHHLDPGRHHPGVAP